MDKEKAATIAAEWWTDQLKNSGGQNVGVAAPSFLANLAENISREMETSLDEKLIIFQRHLEDNLLEMISQTGWKEDDPIRGRALRTVGVDYHPSKELGEAAKKAGISNLLFPVKSMMWIDPDGVRVSLGYRGKIEKITLENTENRENIQVTVDWQETE